MNINTVVLGGNLTKDIELRYSQAGTPVASFTIAVNRSWKDKQGEWHILGKIKCKTVKDIKSVDKAIEFLNDAEQAGNKE